MLNSTFSLGVLVSVLLTVTAFPGFTQQTEQTFYDAEKKIKRENYHTKKSGDTIIKEGTYRIFYKNGKIWQEGNYKDGKLEGLWKTFHENGKLKQEVTYKNNLREGSSVIYYDDGLLYQELFYKNDLLEGKVHIYHPYTEEKRLMEVAEYRNDTLHGERVTYSEGGIIQSRVHYRQGKPNGISEMYYDNGQISERAIVKDGVYEGEFVSFYKDSANGPQKKCMYVHGKLNGPYTGYYPNGGSVMMTGTYVNDSLQGEYIYYYPSKDKKSDKGLVLEKGMYKDNYRTGTWNSYYPDGTIYTTGNFTKGKFNGYWTVNFKTGKPKQLGSYLNGAEDGEWKLYHENGKLYTSGKYVLGKRDGPWDVFYEDGTPLAKYSWKNGQLHGKQIAYDKTGKLIEEKVYENGVLKP